MTIPATGSSMPEKPTYGRCFRAALAICALCVPAIAAGDEPALTETEAVRLAMARPALAELLDGEVGLASSDEIGTGIWPNPIVSYNREQTFGSDATAEDYVLLSQAFDLSGRRGLRSDAARHRTRLASLEATSERLAVVAEVRLRFHEVLLQQGRGAALDAWSRRIEATAQTIALREAAGDVSAYDRRRLERERASAVARREVERASLLRARSRLAAMLAAPGAVPRWEQVRGALIPMDLPLPRDQLVRGASSRPELRALEQSRIAADIDRRAAGRWWIPELTLGAGFKSVDLGSGRASGFLVAASMPLPTFDRGQGDAARAAAQARIARAELRLERAELVGEIRGLWDQATQLTSAALRFRQDAVGSSAELVRMAELGYRAGEIGILELLDAHRSTLEAELQALDLAWAARRARIELDRLTGGSR